MSTFSTPTPQPQLVSTDHARRSLTIGLPANRNAKERRFPLTPEGAQMLIDQGYTIKIEEGAAVTIHYTDNSYRRIGANVVSRSESLAADIVISMSSLDSDDVVKMRRGSMLLSLVKAVTSNPEALKCMLSRNIIAIGVDLILDENGNRPFADILAEIDGRAAMTRAASLLADSVHGKGILLGGVAGIVPCEVTIIGSDIAARSAARAATGTGAVVRMFDNDIYRLRSASHELGPQIITSALHPKVLGNALRSADVVVYTGVEPSPYFGSDIVDIMKRGVIVFDLTCNPGKSFPTLPSIDLAMASPLDISLTEPSRACYVNTGSAVARTAAMALSNTFITLLRQVVMSDNMPNAIRMLPGLSRSVLTFMGKPVNTEIAQTCGLRPVDINIYLTLS